MGTKTVRLDEDVYERIREKKRDDETFSEAIDRLVSDYTLTEFAGDTDADGVEKIEAALKRLDERDRDSREEMKR